MNVLVSPLKETDYNVRPCRGEEVVEVSCGDGIIIQAKVEEI